MANAKQHALIGASVGAVGWLLYCKLVDRPVEIGEVLLAAGVGLIGGLLPDILEPAIDPNHRRFFHSYAATALLAHANHHVSEYGNPGGGAGHSSPHFAWFFQSSNCGFANT